MGDYVIKKIQKESLTVSAMSYQGGMHILRSCVCICIFLSLFFIPIRIAHAEMVHADGELENKDIIAVFPKFFPPYFITDKEGNTTGFAVEVLDAVAQQAGLTITYLPKETWNDVTIALKMKEAHIIPNMGISEDRKQGMLFTAPMDTFLVSAFIRNDTKGIETLNDLSGHIVGVVKTNSAENIFSKRQDISLQRFDSFSDGLFALLVGTIDAFAYPESVIWKSAIAGGFQNKIHAIGPHLVHIDRAIAVRNDLPKLHQTLDQELKKFVSSEEYEVLYRKWFGTSLEPSFIKLEQWGAIGLSITLFMALIYFSWTRQKLTLSKLPKTPNAITGINTQKRFFLLLALMLMVATVVTGTTIWTLYTTAFEEAKNSLLETARSHARLIKSIATFSKTYGGAYSPGAMEATLSQVKEGLRVFSGKVEITLARRNGDQIEFILRQRASRLYETAPVPIDSSLAEPMRLALAGMSGTTVGLDYRSELVLAAHHPIDVYNLGIVIKIDVADLRSPYLRAAVISALVGLAVTIFAIIIFFHISNPILLNILEKERRYRMLVEGQDDLICRNLPDTTLLMVNDAYSRFFGEDKDRIHGTKFIRFIPESFHSEVYEHLLSFTPEHPTARQEHPLIRWDGAIRWTQWTNTASFDDQGKLLEFVAVGRDVTEQKANEDIITSFFEQSLNLHLIVGFDGIIHRVNLGWDRIVGYQASELIGRQYLDFIHPDDIQTTTDEMSKLKQGKRTLYFENRYRCKDGSFCLIAWSAVPSLDNKLVYAAGNNITEQRQAEEDRNHLEEALRLSQKMEAVGQLAGGIAHDYNNMLGIILGSLDLLSHRVDGDPKAMKYLEVAREGVNRGTSITRKLLNFSSGELGELQKTNVNDFITETQDLIIRSLTPIINVKTYLSEDLWPVKIDPGDFKDALLNICLNARDAMPEGGLLVIETNNKVLDKNYIKLNPSASIGDHVVISISDTGTGMSPALIERIFQPFFTTKEVGKGTGLGLSMVYGFAQRSGGHIKVYSEQGKGTTFKIYLPRLFENTDEINQAPVRINGDVPHGSETILVVEDEKELADVAVFLLESLGYTTLRAENARQAIEILQQQKHIDLVFSDVVMPGSMNGYKLAIEVLKKHPGIKVLLTSGFTTKREMAMNGDKPLYDQLSANLLGKPYNQNELADAVRRILDGEEKS